MMDHSKDPAQEMVGESGQVPGQEPGQDNDVYVFPMAFAQQRLWFLEQLQPGSALYHLTSLLEVHGPLVHAALARASNGVIARHESLRTTFAMADNQPVQLIARHGEIEVPVHDHAGAADPARRREDALAAAADRGRRPFSLSRGPLLRVELFRLAADHHLLLVVMHHIVSDGWSMGVFVREMTRLYEAHGQAHDGAHGQERDAGLPPLSIQYADYAGWQRDWLTGEVRETQLGFWREHLHHAPPLLDLPTDRPRPAVQRFRGSTLAFAIPGPLVDRVRGLCQQTKTTPFMLLLGVYAALLGRYSRQHDVVVGTPIANRNRAETADLIGFFVNTLALRIRLDDAPSLLALLHRIRQLSLAAHAHQDVPFDQVVTALAPERNLGHTPLFQAMFAYQNVPADALSVADLVIRQLPVNDGTAKFDLTLFVDDQGEDQPAGAQQPTALSARLEYSTDLFDQATIERMRDGFLLLLERALDYPTRPLEDLPLLTPEHGRHLLVDWNHTQAEVPRTSLHALIEEQAARTPAAPALRRGDAVLSFAQLDARANQLAHYLRQRGVGPGTVVGVCAPRRPETIIALLGILKAGGAYLPLDPSYPMERLRFMAGDAGLRHLLHAEQRTGLAADSADLCSIDLIADQADIAACPETPVQAPVKPETPAYVIYTSGSTGKPKGVRIPHHGVVNYVCWARHSYPLAPPAAVPLISALSFDATITALWVPLAAGCCVELLVNDVNDGNDSDEGNGDLEALANALNQGREYALLKITPAHMDALAHLVTTDSGPPRVCALVIGGEALLDSHIAWWQRHAPDTRLINEYGPTETVVGCAVYTVPPAAQAAAAGHGVPIGRPIANTRLYVLDPGGRPVPAGMPGELYIGGAGVGLGYHERPALTAERFVTLDELPALREALAACDGQDSAPARLYRSGDLVRHDTDGNLVYLGRIDQQVKLRGFRIELGEIEATLAQHPDIAAAAVTLREEPPGRKRLIAYLVPADDRRDAPTHDQIAAFLLQRLPEYMVPAATVVLAALPLTGNGKVDKAALPAPARPDTTGAGIADGTGGVSGGDGQTALAGHERPRDGIEATLAGIWQQILGPLPIGRSSNFFGLGGDSILAMQMVSRARAAGLTLTPRLIFQHQTVAALAAAVARQSGAKSAASAPIMDPATLQGEVPLTPIQRWFAGLDLAAFRHFNQSVLLRVDPALDPDALGRSLDRLVHLHPALRLRFQRQGHDWIQSYAPAAPVPLAVHDLDDGDAGRSWPDALRPVDAAMQADIALDRAPLLRAALLRRSDDARLLLVAHHLIMDGVSWRILLEDLALLLAGGQPLPASTPFSLWAEHLSARARDLDTNALAGRAQPRALDRWCPVVRQVPALPGDLADGDNTVASAGTVTTRLDQDTTRALLHTLPAQTRASVEEALLTALALAHRRWIEAPDTEPSVLVLELESHGRHADDQSIDLSRSVGWFTSMYPVRIELPAGNQPGAALKAVKEQVRPLAENNLEYGIWRYLHPDAEVRRRLIPDAPIPILFNYLGQLDSAVAQGPLRGLASDIAGATRATANRRTHVLEVNAYVTGDQLVIEWEYSRACHHERSIQRFGQAFEQTLGRLLGLAGISGTPNAKHAPAPPDAPNAGDVPAAADTALAPSDFPAARVSAKDLNNLLARLKKKGN